MNTQLRPTSEDDLEVIEDAFADVIDDFKTIDVFSTMIKFLPPHENDTYASPTIVSDNIQAIIERGKKPKGRRVHAHLLIRITHRSKLQLDIAAIRTFFNTQLQPIGVSNVHLDVRLVPENINSVMEYIHKEFGVDEQTEDAVQELTDLVKESLRIQTGDDDDDNNDNAT